MNRSKLRISSVIAVVLGVLSATPLRAAEYDLDEYRSLVNRAAQKGVVRVLVGLDVNGSLDAIRQNRVGVMAAARAKANAVLAELGSNAWGTGLWSNGLGQMGVYVTPEGLQKLAGSANVRSLGRDVMDGMRIGVYDSDGRIAAVEAEIDAIGFADVEITLNLENLDFDIRPDGGTVYKPSNAQRNELRGRLPAFLNSVSERAVLNLADLRARIDALAFQGPTMGLRLTREGLYLLKEHADVRAIRLVRESAAPRPYFDPEALETAKKEGSAEVIIDLAGPRRIRR